MKQGRLSEEQIVATLEGGGIQQQQSSGAVPAPRDLVSWQLLAKMEVRKRRDRPQGSGSASGEIVSEQRPPRPLKRVKTRTVALGRWEASPYFARTGGTR
jgi:hypothetical protein